VEASTGLLAAAVFHSSPIPEFAPPSQSSRTQDSTPFSDTHWPRHLHPTRDSNPFIQISDLISPMSSPSPVLNTPPIGSPDHAWVESLAPQHTSPSYAVPRTQFLHNTFPINDAGDFHLPPCTTPPSQHNYVLQGPGSFANTPPYPYHTEAAHAVHYNTYAPDDWLSSANDFAGGDSRMGHDFLSNYPNFR